MGRYTNTKTNKKDGIDRYETTFYSDIPERNDDIFVRTQEGDRFDLLAFKYYGTPSLWWYIAKANKMKFMNIEPGKVIRIPASTQSAQSE